MLSKSCWIGKLIFLVKVRTQATSWVNYKKKKTGALKNIAPVTTSLPSILKTSSSIKGQLTYCEDASGI